MIRRLSNFLSPELFLLFCLQPFFSFLFLFFSAIEGMAAATRTQAGSLAPVGPVCMALSQQSKPFMAEAIKKIELKLNRKLDLTTREQITLDDLYRTVIEGFVNWLLVIENKISHPERSHHSSLSKMELLKEFDKDLGTLRHDVNQLMEARNEIGSDVNLRFIQVADWLGIVEFHFATVPGSIQTANTKRSFPKSREDQGVTLFKTCRRRQNVE